MILQLLDHLRTKLPLERVGIRFKRNASPLMPSEKETPAVNSERDFCTGCFSFTQMRITRSDQGKIMKSLVCLLQNLTFLFSSSLSFRVLSHSDNHYFLLVKAGKNCMSRRLDYILGLPSGTSGKEPPANEGRLRETWVQSLGWGDPLEEGMATHSCILAWRIPWTEEPGRLQSTGLQRLYFSVDELVGQLKSILI